MSRIPLEDIISRWRLASAGGSLPARGSFNSRDLGEALTSGILADLGGKSPGRIRFAGARISAALPAARQGRSFLDFWEPRSAALVWRAASRAARIGAPADCAARLDNGTSPGSRVTVCILPLQAAAGVQAVIMISMPDPRRLARAARLLSLTAVSFSSRRIGGIAG